MTLASLVGLDIFEVDLAWYNGPKTSKLVSRISELTLGQLCPEIAQAVIRIFMGLDGEDFS